MLSSILLPTVNLFYAFQTELVAHEFFVIRKYSKTERVFRNAPYTFGFDDADGKALEVGHVFWTVTSAYPVAVFIIVPVDDVVTAILNAPK
jgi:hypothetical protein